MKVAVKSLDNKKVGDLDLSDAIFGVKVRADVLHRMVNWQLAKRRSGNHKTKGVSEISGTGAIAAARSFSAPWCAIMPTTCPKASAALR